MSKERKSSARRGDSGFTLIEMLVATVLSTIVLLGLFNFTANMTSASIRNQRMDTTSAWAQAGIDSMSSDIAAAGAIGYPPSGAAGADTLIVCTNWTMRGTTPGQVVTTPATPTNNYYYCFDTTDAAPYGNAILRKVMNNTGTCPTVAPACTQASYSSGARGGDTIVATGIYRNGVNPVFVQDPNTLNAVRLRYAVGNPTGNSVSAGGNGGTITEAPVTIPYDTEIILEN